MGGMMKLMLIVETPNDGVFVTEQTILRRHDG